MRKCDCCLSVGISHLHRNLKPNCVDACSILHQIKGKVKVLVTQSCPTLQPHRPARLLCPWNSPGNNTGVGSHSLLQRISSAQGSKPGLLHCRQVFQLLSHQGSLRQWWIDINYCWGKLGFPGSSMVKNLPLSARDTKDVGSIPRLGRCPGLGNGNPLQYSHLENSMHRGAWWATVHGAAKSWTGNKQSTTAGTTGLLTQSRNDLYLILYFQQLED